MVLKCCAPNCKGNYTKEDKVSVFRFPRDEMLKQKWISSLRRESFVPTKNSRVCERHFEPSDIERETSFYDERTGLHFTAPLAFPRLKSNAVPKLLVNCPSYLSSNSKYSRESVKKRRVRLENKQCVLVENVNCKEVEKNDYRI